MAKQLSDNYGDRAWTVCALAEQTGDQWPVHGVRLSPHHPYVEAEVLYATRHEYACTAIDVLARRTRLAFVDAQAALAALPRVIEIMSRELGWSRARQRGEYLRGVQFLGSMGLTPGVGAQQGGARRWTWVPWRAWLEEGFGLWLRLGHATSTTTTSPSSSSFKPSYSCTKSEADEVDALRALFDRHASVSVSVETTTDRSSHVTAPARLSKATIQPALTAFAREWPGLGYEGLREADYRYVFAQEGLRDRSDVDFDEFVEVGFRISFRVYVLMNFFFFARFVDT